MNIALDGQYAVITGASSGLGYAMAKALLEKGATVALSARPGEKLDNAVETLVQNGLDAYALPMDVCNEDSIIEAVSWIREEWKRIDLLVNNAALMMHRIYPDFLTSPKPFYEIHPDVFRKIVDTNLTGYFLVARGFIPMMIERNKGRIVNISTSNSTMNRFAPYGPSRAGSEALSNIMAAELNKFGIMVNLLLPGGAVNTGGILNDMNQELPFTLLSPEIMADPIVFLASSLADGITGERIIANEFNDWLKRKAIHQ
ncbi:MAG: SDR family oxidoreductase [Sedimentisphaerales bacterium]|nr:SDR family oxidoreductase [Sedimentisphaerales bacterium]